MNIREIFENLIKIEPKVMSIESLFNNEERVSKTNYKPSYQRNYVWDDEKATYFIESILLGTEIPPLIYFRNSDRVEVVDGRQRYQTILRFKNNEFKLKKNGLQKLEDIGIANKYFRSIEQKLQDLFWDTKLRIIEFSFHSQNKVNDDIEELVKKEIFKRYNSGITPLKPAEIDKAAYISDDLNSYFRDKIKNDQVIYGDISSLLHFEKSSIEIILKKIRQLLVLHRIPIKYYSVKKDSVIAKYFDLLSSNIGEDEIPTIYNSFIRKINILKQLNAISKAQDITFNRLIFECVFWALSVVEVESGTLEQVVQSTLKSLSSYISENIEAFKMQRSSFSKELHNRYHVTASFFSTRFKIDFTVYLQNNPDFKSRNQAVGKEQQHVTSFEELRINKPEPSSIAIDDICRQMARQRFLIRPPYQRSEVINKKKSSAIIESILLGIKLPPIFVFKRKDDISEVLDGQQRLLSILGFISKPYLDEKSEQRLSDKNNYSLNLKNGILTDLNGKKFEQLSKDEREKIKNFDLWIIEISEKNNEQFESIDLFIRLNNKPYPIKEDTFEMWNSYVSRDVIETLKSIHKNNKDWFYFRKNNSRMEDENIYTALAYLQFKINKHGSSDASVLKDLDIYKIGDKINFRVKSKVEITKLLENYEAKSQFIKACFDFEFGFLKKVKELLRDDNSIFTVNDQLSLIFNKENNRRTQQSFYALWYFLYETPYEIIIKKKDQIRAELHKLFSLMDDVESRLSFDKSVRNFKNKYNISETPKSYVLHDRIQNNAPINLGSISVIAQGLNHAQLIDYSTQRPKESYPFFKAPSIQHFIVHGESKGRISLDNLESATKETFESKQKIIVRRTTVEGSRLAVGLYEGKAAFGDDVLIINLNRYGYDYRFILSLLASRLIFHVVTLTTSHLNKRFNISTSVLKSIPIPITSLADQKPFIRLVDLIFAVADRDTKILGFFERLLDAMVYEVYLPMEMTESGSAVIQYLSDIPVCEGDAANQFKVASEYYDVISRPSHPISLSLLKLLNAQLVTEIEGVV